jgi:hypothetical protein
MKGIDCTATINSLAAKALKDSGIGFVCRYLVPISMAWKRLTAVEARAITGVGLGLLTIYESDANRALKGTAGGAADVKTAQAEAKIVAQPAGSAIYFAVDFDVQKKDLPTIGEYFLSAKKSISPYTIGGYGSYDLCEYLYSIGITNLWQTYAWSHGKVSAHANVLQHLNGANVCGIPCDLNDSFGGEGFWNGDSIKVEGGNIMTDWNKSAVDFVTYFQKTFKITADGKAGTATLAAFDKMVADNTNLTGKINQVKIIIGGQ